MTEKIIMTKKQQRIGFCGRTRREFIWQTGGGFGAAALAVDVVGRWIL